MILVTGAAGMVGRSLLQKLTALGIECHGITRGEINLARAQSLAKSIRRPPDTIVHLAAAVPHNRGGDSWRAAFETYQIDREVARAAVMWGSRVFYASTCLLYDRSTSELKHESSKVGPRKGSPYSRAKFIGEKLFRTLEGTTVFRLSAPIGLGMNTELVLPRFVRRALSETPIQIWGAGSREQDFIDVSDVTELILSALVRSKLPPTLNLVSGTPVTMTELAAIVTSTLDRGTVEVLLDQKPDPLEGEFARYSASLSSEALDWSAKIGLATSIRRLGEYYLRGNF